jgi:hypothetical protein
MGFSEARYMGHMAFRGLAEYADGQPFEPKVNYIYGRGVRAGFICPGFPYQSLLVHLLQ